jgi:hypothetical protein
MLDQVTKLTVGYGSSVVDALGATIIAEPDVMENVVVPAWVDKIPP